MLDLFGRKGRTTYSLCIYIVIDTNNLVSGQPCDGPMGISVALSPATTTVTMSKSMITNASFRTKKLPGEH